MTKGKSSLKRFEETLSKLFRVSKQELDKAVEEERAISRELREATQANDPELDDAYAMMPPLTNIALIPRMQKDPRVSLESLFKRL